MEDEVGSATAQQRGTAERGAVRAYADHLDRVGSLPSRQPETDTETVLGSDDSPETALGLWRKPGPRQPSEGPRTVRPFNALVSGIHVLQLVLKLLQRERKRYSGAVDDRLKVIRP